MSNQANPATGTELCLKATLLGVLINACMAAIKGIAGIVGKSNALVADAIESTSDIASSLIVYGGLKIASIPADKDHPYGHGKAEPLASIIVSLALLTASLSIAITSIREIQAPQHTPEAFTLVVLLIVVIVKEYMFRYVTKIGKQAGSTAVKTDAWHHRSDALTSLAAFMGISISILGGKGYEAADDWAALLTSLIIAMNAIRLLKPSLAEVMDRADHTELEDEVRQVAGGVPGVDDLDICIVRKMGLDYYVDLHVLVDGQIPVREGHEIAHHVKDALRGHNPRIIDVLIHVEPSDNPLSPKQK